MKQPVTPEQLAVGAGFGLLAGLVGRFNVSHPPSFWTLETLGYLAGSALGGAVLYGIARWFVRFARPKD